MYYIINIMFWQIIKIIALSSISWNTEKSAQNLVNNACHITSVRRLKGVAGYCFKYTNKPFAFKPTIRNAWDFALMYCVFTLSPISCARFAHTQTMVLSNSRKDISTAIFPPNQSAISMLRSNLPIKAVRRVNTCFASAVFPLKNFLTSSPEQEPIKMLTTPTTQIPRMSRLGYWLLNTSIYSPQWNSYFTIARRRGTNTVRLCLSILFSLRRDTKDNRELLVCMLPHQDVFSQSLWSFNCFPKISCRWWVLVDKWFDVLMASMDLLLSS